MRSSQQYEVFEAILFFFQTHLLFSEIYIDRFIHYFL